MKKSYWMVLGFALMLLAEGQALANTVNGRIGLCGRAREDYSWGSGYTNPVYLADSGYAGVVWSARARANCSGAYAQGDGVGNYLNQYVVDYSYGYLAWRPFSGTQAVKRAIGNDLITPNPSSGRFRYTNY